MVTIQKCKKNALAALCEENLAHFLLPGPTVNAITPDAGGFLTPAGFDVHCSLTMRLLGYREVLSALAARQHLSGYT
jgi:hypothetical protein